ncbi:Uncharacterised protein [uncultured archaeon]|nr:Uncharacterised protein [uncultured archaeon]
MGKTLATLALCLGLICNSFSGTVPEYRDASPVSAITNNNRAIKSSTSGKVDLPLGVIKDYLAKPVFSGKVLLCLGESPYYPYQEPNAAVFYNSQGHTSRYEVVRSSSISNGLDQVSRIYGNRFFGNFDSVTFLTLRENQDKSVQYSNDMYVIIENRFFNSFFRGLLNFPLLGDKLKKSFQDEQDNFVKSVNRVVSRASQSPQAALKSLESYTNGPVSFSQGEIQYFKESLEKLDKKK